jgi:hypothetical protein
LLVCVRDPLSLNSGDLPTLLIGSYVRVEISGKTIFSVIPLARDHLRNGDVVWIMNLENGLEIRPVEIVFRNKLTVYVRHGLEPGERIVVTDIEAPVENMPLCLVSSLSDETLHPKSQEEAPL